MDEEEIRRLDKEAGEAFLRGEIATLQRLFSDEFVVTNPFNQVMNKQEVLEALESGRIKHSVYEREIEVLRFYADTAVVMGREVVVDGGEMKNRRYTEVWLRREGRWQVIAAMPTRSLLDGCRIILPVSRRLSNKALQRRP